MNTDIFQNHDLHPGAPNPYSNLNPVQLYLVLTLPLTAVTLSVWFYFHWMESRRAQFEKLQHLDSGWI